MNASQAPRCPDRLSPFRARGSYHRLVVLHIALAHKRLKVAAELHPIRRVHVDCLHLATQTLVMKKGVHHYKGIPKHHAIHPLVAVLIGAKDLISDGMPGITEKVELDFDRLAMPAKRLDDSRRGQPFVHEQGKCRHVEGEPLRFACPVQERLSERSQLIDRILKISNSRLDCAVIEDELTGLFEGVRRLELRCIPNAADQPIRKVPNAVLSIPIECRGEGGVVSICRGRLLLSKLRLGSRLGPKRAVSLWMSVAF